MNIFHSLRSFWKCFVESSLISKSHQHAANLQQTGASAATDQCSRNPTVVIHTQSNMRFLGMVLCRALQVPSKSAYSGNTASRLQPHQTHLLLINHHSYEDLANDSSGDFFPAASPVIIPASCLPSKSLPDCFKSPF